MSSLQASVSLRVAQVASSHLGSEVCGWEGKIK